MNYSIEHKINGYNQYGHDVSVSVSEKMLLKLEDPPNILSGALEDGLLKVRLIRFENIRDHDFLVVGFDNGSIFHIAPDEIEWFDKIRD